MRELFPPPKPLSNEDLREIQSLVREVFPSGRWALAAGFGEAARKSEKELSRELKRRVGEELEIEGSQSKPWISASHSFGQVLAAGLSALEEECQGMGLDLEPWERPMMQEVVERVLREEEKELGIEPICAWAIKEACFKADPRSQGSVLSHYLFESWDPKARLGRLRKPGSSAGFSAACGKIGDWAVAFAVASPTVP